MSSQRLPALVLPVIKERDLTSFDVVRKLKKLLPSGWKKIGHFGTLDPFAQGLLLIGVNSALRANQMVQDFSPKTYIAVGKLGEKTDTGDDTGKIEETAIVPKLETDKVNAALQGFLGEYWQSPPYYSATKHQGKALYEWAREGVFIDKPKVKRTIYGIKLLEFTQQSIKFEVSVSSGTYIRKLIEDIAEKLNTLGHLNFLERTRIGEISLEDAFSVEKLEDLAKSAEQWNAFGLSIDKLIILNHVITDQQVTYKNGIALLEGEYEIKKMDAASSQDLFWVYDKEHNLLGMGEIFSQSQIKPVFNLPAV